MVGPSGSGVTRGTACMADESTIELPIIIAFAPYASVTMRGSEMGTFLTKVYSPHRTVSRAVHSEPSDHINAWRYHDVNDGAFRGIILLGNNPASSRHTSQYRSVVFEASTDGRFRESRLAAHERAVPHGGQAAGRLD